MMRTRIMKTRMMRTRTDDKESHPPQDLVISGNQVRLRSKALSDAKDDYAWQRDAELARLDATEVLIMPFSEYLMNYIHYLSLPVASSVRFAIDTTEGRHIGNCTYYNIDPEEGKAEVGIMIGDREYWGKGYGTDSMTAMLNYIFENTSLNLLHLKTLDWNLRARRCFLRCCFTRHGASREDGHDFLIMELTRQQWLNRNKATGEKVG